MNRMLSAGVALTIGVLGAGAAAASITYNVNQTIGGGSVVGFITTDGATGVLSESDIIDWNLTLNGIGATFNLTPGDSGVHISGNDVSADLQHLYFDFDGADGGRLLFQDGPENGQHYYCDNTTAGDCVAGASVVPIYYTDPSSQFGPGPADDIIGTAGVPEPAAWAMMLLGFGLAGAALRRRPVPA